MFASCMVLDSVVETCDRVRYSDEVYAFVVWVCDIARGVEVRRSLVGPEQMVAWVAAELVVVAYSQNTW